jgi:hypothetical protein
LLVVLVVVELLQLTHQEKVVEVQEVIVHQDMVQVLYKDQRKI